MNQSRNRAIYFTIYTITKELNQTRIYIYLFTDMETNSTTTGASIKLPGKQKHMNARNRMLISKKRLHKNENQSVYLQVCYLEEILNEFSIRNPI